MPKPDPDANQAITEAFARQSCLPGDRRGSRGPAAAGIDRDPRTAGTSLECGDVDLDGRPDIVISFASAAGR